MNKDLRQVDPEIYRLIMEEEQRQQDTICLIASENHTSVAVMQASGSVLTNKYSEGYPGARYYEGQEVIDQIESLAQKRACELFGAEHANVQAYSGSPANMAVYYALLNPHDKILGLHLHHGGHLTHGWTVSFTSKFYAAIQYPVDQKTELIDYGALHKLARIVSPRLIIAGATAYPRQYDFETFRAIADEVKAYFLADISHIAGLVAAGVHPSPVASADVVTATTQKTLRGPRGALILCKKKYAEAIDRAIFPALQGGPHNHTTAAIATALHQAATPEFRQYIHQTVANAKALAEALKSHHMRLISGGTDTHLILIDLRPLNLGGRDVAQSLNRAGLVANCNTVPFDTRKPMDPSGIRVGTPAVTTRGMTEKEMPFIAGNIARVINHTGDEKVERAVRAEVREFLQSFPVPGSIFNRT